MYMIAMFDTRQAMYTVAALNAIADICASSLYNVTVVLHTSRELEQSDRRVLERALLCSEAPGGQVPLVIEVCSQCKYELTVEHRKYMRQHIDEADLFLYSEDDMVLTLSTLRAWERELDIIKRERPDDYRDIMPGFLRYENPVMCSNDHTIKSIASTVGYERVMWEYRSHELYAARLREGGERMIFTKNPHQALWLLSREQVLYLEDKCGFLTSTKRPKGFELTIRVWMSSAQLVRGCGMIRLVPLDRMELFLVHHAPDKNSWRQRAHRVTLDSFRSLVAAKFEANDALDFRGLQSLVASRALGRAKGRDKRGLITLEE